MVIGRISDRATFAALRHAPRTRRGELTVAYLAPGGDRGHGDDGGDGGGDRGGGGGPRVAFAIGRSVGNAVTRNRLRRRLRAIARGIGLAPGDWLVIARPGAASASFGSLHEWLSGAVDALRESFGRPGGQR